MKHLRLSFKALFVLSILLFGSINGFTQNRYEARIIESEGDAEEHGPTSLTPGAIYYISALEMVYDTLEAIHRGQQTVGLRFTNITIPQDALILNAYVQFSSSMPSTDSTSLVIWAEDTDDAPIISATLYDISSRAKTAASVPWVDIPDWDGFALEGVDQRTPELKSIVQSIVEKAGWMTGNSMCFIIQGYGTRRATCWDLDPDKAPKLVVDFGSKITETVCDSYISPSGKTWTSSGSYFDTIPNSFGGDSIILVDLTVLESTASTITESVCDTYTSPSGKTWTVSGNYRDTIPNAAGCDSVITIELTVNSSSIAIISESVCDSYTSPSGKTWTSSGTYLDTIPNTMGCDSVIAVELTVNTSSTSSLIETACDSYISPSGKTWTSSGTYLDTIPNTNGCDSVITVELTVNNSSSASITETVCGSYTSPSGSVWTVSGIYMDTIPNAAGCDSLITIDLTVNSSSTSNITETACGSYSSPSGKVWTVSGNYVDTIPNAAGCDSIIGINLMVHTIDTSITVTGENVLSANESDAQYQWLRNNDIIDGATAQSYSVTETGSYAVVITKNDCVDTSGVYNIQIVTGLTDVSFRSDIAVYPNPTKGNFTLDMGTEYETLSLRLYNITGKLVSINEYKACREIEYQIDGAKGIYFLRVSSGKGEQARIKIMKE